MNTRLAESISTFAKEIYINTGYKVQLVQVSPHIYTTILEDRILYPGLSVAVQGPFTSKYVNTAPGFFDQISKDEADDNKLTWIELNGIMIYKVYGLNDLEIRFQ